ncbi:MAG: hypothetical protein JO366_11005 [Methylobacteriaceae bacterium]|nr:hypothetical protein [Methylobacteriaceae bacterium]
MTRHGGIESLPQIDVLDRLLLGRPPAVTFPARHPAGHGAAEVLRIGVQVDDARTRESLERHDRGRQLHPIVGGLRLAAEELLFALPEGQHRTPAAGAGIAGTGAVGPGRHALGRTHLKSPYSRLVPTF